MAISFDLFGTLVDAARPADPAAAVAAELRERGVAVPDDWADAYAEVHIDAPEGAEVPLPAHVSAALRSRGVDAPANAARRAVVAAFDPEVRTRPGAAAAVAAAAERGPVGLFSNCSVPELVARTLIRSDVDRDAFGATVSSVACGWRKPDPQAFETLAGRLDVAPETLVHVGDNRYADGGVSGVGGRFVDATETDFEAFADALRRGASLSEFVSEA
ncbi:had superfamily hydrolase [Halogeometricum pallidum JCM 14848]|uniref:Had superfamily hydrolase n=1 Tax=Halogeometricum pallidum JCM 14848 TaxID=1227487 RepID=M0D3D9_HALPD|nr:HAD family hydrolase [Halogeometricum pallidum]ELZ29955.1 had superfamily hydrolase [Halogeometricum pallidum JCM 14848]